MSQYSPVSIWKSKLKLSITLLVHYDISPVKIPRRAHFPALN